MQRIISRTHQDIKPANILISRPLSPSEPRIVFKLIDFAFTNFQRWSKLEDAHDFDQGGTQLYSAPELCRHDRFLQHSTLPVETNIDTWSFGAVLSETLVWSTLGKEGVEKYAKRRLDATRGHPLLEKGGYEGCFHDGVTVLDVVREMHTEALEAVKHNMHKYTISSHIMLLAESMLVDQEARPSDVVLYNDFARIIRVNRGTLSTEDNADEEVRRSDSEMPAAFQVQGPSRMLPPQLPPGHPSATTSTRQSRNSKGKGLQSATSSREPQILQQNGSASNSRLPTRRIVFQDPPADQRPPEDSQADIASSLSPDDVEVTSSNRYEECTIAQAHSWVSSQKGKSRDSASSISAGLPGPVFSEKLNNRNQVFLFDDSASMANHWVTFNGVTITFKTLGYLVKTCSPNGLEAYFGVWRKKKQTKKRKDIIEMLRKAEPTSQCNMRYCLEQILEHWWSQNRQWLETKFEKKTIMGLLRPDKAQRKRGLNVYVFTDGLWNESSGLGGFCGVDAVVKKYYDKMIDHNVDSRTVGIEFIRFGNDPVGSARVQGLADQIRNLGASENIVDTEPSNGNVWKMLLGSFDRPDN